MDLMDCIISCRSVLTQTRSEPCSRGWRKECRNSKKVMQKSLRTATLILMNWNEKWGGKRQTLDTMFYKKTIYFFQIKITSLLSYLWNAIFKIRSTSILFFFNLLISLIHTFLWSISALFIVYRSTMYFFFFLNFNAYRIQSLSTELYLIKLTITGSSPH